MTGRKVSANDHFGAVTQETQEPECNNSIDFPQPAASRATLRRKGRAAGVCKEGR